MLKASRPIAVIMQRRKIDHPWVDDAWAAIGALSDPGGLPPLQVLRWSEEQESYLVSGLQLALYPDEDDGYFENWAAPSPKIFVMWRMQGERAMPVLASASYGEGARMLDSGESANGVDMPRDIYDWLTEYLQANYQPRPHRGRQHG